MSKQKKEQQKKKKREQVRKERLKKYRDTLDAQTLGEGVLAYVSDLIKKKKDYATARATLLEYVERYPKHIRPYSTLATVCQAVGDFPNMFWAAEKLLEIGQRTRDDYMLYYAACLRNKLPATMLACIDQIRRRFHEEVDVKADALRKDLVASFREETVLAGDDLTAYSDEDLLELLQLHEKSLLYLSAQRFDLTAELCDRLVERFPFFRSAYNNKALAVMFDQGPDKAEHLLQRAFEHHPNNLFVIAFKIRQLALLGRHDEIADFCERLAAIPLLFSNKYDFFTGKIEAFAWADDLDRILETYQTALEEMGDQWTLELPSCVKSVHYAAVAHARLGNTDQAIELWESIAGNPHIEEVAEENLEDIKKPVGERNGPWFFCFTFWLPAKLFTMLRQARITAEAGERTDPEENSRILEQQFARCFKKALSIWPSLDRTLIEMLRRGGPDSRHWVLMFLKQLQTPEFVQAVLDFVKGREGSDECRRGFLEELFCEKLITREPIHMWRNGEMVEQKVLGFEVHREKKEIEPPISAQSEQKILEARAAAIRKDYKKALALTLEVNEEEPGRASILYNIASYIRALGQVEMYDKAIDTLAQMFPDYFFVKIAMAKRLTIQGKTDEAWEILSPLHDTDRMHVSEFKALASAAVMYHLAKGDEESAQSLHDIAVGVCGEEFQPMQVFRNEFAGS